MHAEEQPDSSMHHHPGNYLPKHLLHLLDHPGSLKLTARFVVTWGNCPGSKMRSSFHVRRHLHLSLAYDIVKAHGGELKVATKEGEGSEFIIQLPV